MENSSENWYGIDQIESIDTPALVVYPERVKSNIQAALEMIKDPARLRPHVKTNKTIEVSKMMLEAGIEQFKCATIAEAEMLVMAGAKDILLAYQPIGPKLQRFLNLIQHFPDVTFSCIIDHLDPVAKIAETARSHQIKIPVYIDLNLGTDRTGIDPGKKSEELFEIAQRMEGITVAGFHIYDGHLRQRDIGERKKASDQSYKAVEEMLLSLKSKGYPESVVIAGGTPTFPIHLQRDKVICSPGTFVYWDKGYGETLPEQPFNPAALVLTRVISLPSKGLVCVDLGHKSIASENPIDKRVHFLNAQNLQPVSQSEEHLVLKTQDDRPFKIGDVLYGLPYHICPTVALYERVITIEDHKPAEEWKVISRDRKLKW
jgi:D-serine deaminase-like pyridoxal phosphate-dependent protein